MKKIIILLFVLCTNFLCISYASSGAGDLYKKSIKSVVLIETQNKTGSGVILDSEGTIATCFHVVDSADKITVKTADGTKYKVNGYKYINPAGDIALLTLKTTNKFTPIELGKGTNSVGDTIYALSNPRGIEFVFSDGIISRIEKGGNIQFTAPVSPGSSGAPLLDKTGKLIGIISSQYDISKAQNINFAFPLSKFDSHISDKNIINTKNKLWTDFLVSKATKAQLKQYRYYAFMKKDPSVMYRYLKPKEGKEDVREEDFPFLGLLSMSAYEENFDSSMSKEAQTWFLRSLLNNNSVELSAYGLFLLSLTDKNDNCMDIYWDYLKKYPRTFKVLTVSAGELSKCSKNEECVKNICYKLFEYFNVLAINYIQNRGDE